MNTPAGLNLESIKSRFLCGTIAPQRGVFKSFLRIVAPAASLIARWGDYMAIYQDFSFSAF